VTQNFHRFDINVMPGPRKNKLRRAITEMALALSRKALGEWAKFNPAQLLHKRLS